MSRRVLILVAVFMGSLIPHSWADPTPASPPVFCVRITDIERVPATSSGFRFELEVLNWADMEATGMYIAFADGTSQAGTPPSIVGADIDEDGRGGAVGGTDIGIGVFGNPAHQSGRGRGDLDVCVDDTTIACATPPNDPVNCPLPPGAFDCVAGEVCVDDANIGCVTPGTDPVNCPAGPNSFACMVGDTCAQDSTVVCTPPTDMACPLPPTAFDCTNGPPNDWSVVTTSGTSARWDVGSSPAGTPIPFLDLLGQGHDHLQFALVPGFGLDNTGDTGIDGGPDPYTPDPLPLPCVGCVSAQMSPAPDGSGNVLDGFVLEFANLDIDDRVSLNWFLLNGSAPIGTAGNGNVFGYGTLSIVRVDPGAPAPPLVFLGNSGFERGDNFFDTVHTVPDNTLPDAEFYIEFGPSLTAKFLVPNDNIFNAGINTVVVPAVSSWGMLALVLLVLSAGTILMRARRHDTGALA